MLYKHNINKTHTELLKQAQLIYTPTLHAGIYGEPGLFFKSIAKRGMPRGSNNGEAG